MLLFLKLLCCVNLCRLFGSGCAGFSNCLGSPFRPVEHALLLFPLSRFFSTLVFCLFPALSNGASLGFSGSLKLREPCRGHIARSLLPMAVLLGADFSTSLGLLRAASSSLSRGFLSFVARYLILLRTVVLFFHALSQTLASFEPVSQLLIMFDGSS